MRIVKVIKATPIQIDWMVAKCEGKELVYFNNWFRQNGFDKGFPEAQIDQHLHWQTNFKDRWVMLEDFTHQPQHGEAQILKRACNIDNYSTDWQLAGPIIERLYAEGFEMVQGGPDSGNTRCWAKKSDQADYVFGPTPLIAAMRCFVVSKLGDEVEVPEELCEVIDAAITAQKGEQV